MSSSICWLGERRCSGIGVFVVLRPLLVGVCVWVFVSAASFGRFDWGFEGGMEEELAFAGLVDVEWRFVKDLIRSCFIRPFGVCE